MQIAPVGSLEVALANLATSAAAQQQIATAAVAHLEKSEFAKERPAITAKAQKPESSAVTTPAGQWPIAPDASVVDRSGTSTQAEHVQPIVERQLFDYLIEVEKDSARHQTNPLALASDLIHSLKEMIEPAQIALSGQRTMQPKNADMSQLGDAEHISPDQQQATQVAKT